jgi:S-adenosylmethionine synthetase
MRWVAKNIVEAKLARRCEVQVAYAIGVAEPVSIMVDTFGTGKLPDGRLEQIVREVFDLTPKAIIDTLKLKRPIFTPTASYGHFGRKPKMLKIGGRNVETFTWERADRVKELLSAAR